MEGSESLETTTVTSLSVNCIVQFVNGDKAEKTWNYIMKIWYCLFRFIDSRGQNVERALNLALSRDAYFYLERQTKISQPRWQTLQASQVLSLGVQRDKNGFQWHLSCWSQWLELEVSGSKPMQTPLVTEHIGTFFRVNMDRNMLLQLLWSHMTCFLSFRGSVLCWSWNKHHKIGGTLHIPFRDPWTFASLSTIMGWICYDPVRAVLLFSSYYYVKKRHGRRPWGFMRSPVALNLPMGAWSKCVSKSRQLPSAAPLWANKWLPKVEKRRERKRNLKRDKWRVGRNERKNNRENPRGEQR